MTQEQANVPLEPMENKAVLRCVYCEEEIFPGECYYRIGRDKVCVDCLRDYASDYFSDCVEVAESSLDEEV